jgi:hypothetical protein
MQMERSSSKRVKSDIPLPSGRKALTTNLRDSPLVSSTSQGNKKRERKRNRKRNEQATQSDQEYILRDILQEELRKGKLYYLIDWEGIDPSTGRDFEHTWVCQSSLPWPVQLSTTSTYLRYRNQQRTRMKKQSEIGKPRRK